MKTTHSVSRAPGALPLLGHTMVLLRDPLRFLTSLPAHGDLVRIRLGPVDAAVVCDPGLTRQVLLDDRTFDKGGLLFDRLREVLGDGLGTCPHSRHRRQRRLMQPAFHPNRLPGYAQAMTVQIGETIGQWRDGAVVDVMAEMMPLAMRTTAEALFSGALHHRASRDTLDDIAVVFRGTYRRTVLPPWLNRLPTPANRRYHQARSRLRETLGSVVVAARRADGADHGDLLSALLAARDADSGDASRDHHSLTDTELQDQAVSLLLAGTETTPTTLAWALHLLAHHPDIEDRLHAEVDTVLAGAPARFADLPQLELTRRVITETLRLYPPAWLLTRTVTTGSRLGGHRLSAGTTLVLSPYLLQRRSDLYDHPERFDPDRWDTLHHSPPPRHAFIPFGAGARKCIGDQFGTTNAVLALATITALWRLEPLPHRTVRPSVSTSLIPHGLRLRTLTRTSGNVK